MSTPDPRAGRPHRRVFYFGIIALMALIVVLGIRIAVPALQLRMLADNFRARGISLRCDLPEGREWLRDWFCEDLFPMFASRIDVHLGQEMFNDQDLARLSALCRPRHVGLEATQITDAGLAHLGRMRQLESL